jgi:SnoaL-like domain
MSRAEKIAVVETYLGGLANKDISQVPFAEDVTFEGPRVPKLTGRTTVAGFLTSILPAIQAIRIGEHIVEGDYVATQFEMETMFGLDRVFDRFHVVGGELKAIHSYYYPQK